MMSPEDRQIATHVLKNILSMYLNKEISKEHFDQEMKSYLQFLLSEKGMDVVEIRELTASVGMDIHVNVHLA